MSSITSKNTTFFLSLSKNANESILIVNTQGTFVYANQRAAEMAGYSISKLLKIKITNLVRPNETKAVIHWLKSRLNGDNAQKQYKIKLL